MKFTHLAFCLALIGCSQTENKENQTKSSQSLTMPKQINDSHSYGNYAQANTTHINLNLEADFNKKELKGFVTHYINNNNAEEIIFDTKGLEIEKVTLGDGSEASFELGKEDEILGQPLTVKIKPETKELTIYYKTTPKSEAVQWLNPQQTAYKKSPFLFTQGEAILTRSWIPIQDSPGNKITYEASIQVPDTLTAVMSAEVIPNEETIPGLFQFKMENPIPCYLIALSIGQLEYRSLGKRSGVYAEPNMIDACVAEFDDIEKMIEAAENLYGPYAWGQYDVIVLPPSFPFGGMENPRLTFATPTIIAGDRSLTSLIAHELAHSWSGNLATNSTWNDFWLNEGFTVYFEMRIMEELYGRDYSEMLALLSYQGLLGELEELDSVDTHLKLDLEGRNPDDGMTAIAYDKGYFMLRMIEESIGRDAFDEFLKQYFTDFKFKNLNTEEFLAYINENLEGAEELNLKDWIYQPGLPSNCPKPESNKFELVERAHNFKPNDFSSVVGLNPEKWTTHEWIHYIRNIDVDSWKSNNLFAIADKEFNFTNTGNSEIAAAWFEKSIEGGYEAAYPKMEEFLIHVGRRKFLTPLYSALKENGQIEKAREIYQKARPNYHSVSTNTMDELLGVKKS